MKNFRYNETIFFVAGSYRERLVEFRPQVHGPLRSYSGQRGRGVAHFRPISRLCLAADRNVPYLLPGNQ